jgi:hypothetical protein
MSDEFRKALAAAWSAPTVEVLGDRKYRVLVPDQRFAHDTVSLIVEWDAEQSRWLVSDDGQTKFMLDEDFERVVSVAIGAGAPFIVSGSELVASRSSRLLSCASPLK